MLVFKFMLSGILILAKESVFPKQDFELMGLYR